MPRIRTLKPEHRQHRKIGPLSHLEYRLWVGMLCEADDEGRLVCDSDQLRVLIFGFRAEVCTPDVESALGTLSDSGLIRLYTSRRARYACFLSWPDHQRISHPIPSKLPPPPTRERSGKFRNLPESSRGLRSDLKGREGKGLEGRGLGTGAGNPQEDSDTHASRNNGQPEFKVNDEIQAALRQAPTLGAVPRLWSVNFWRAEVRANLGVDFPAEVLKAEAWLMANPHKAPRKDIPRFFHSWLGRAEREEA